MNEIVVQKFGPIASVFAGRTAENNLASGIQASFPILGFAGKIWQVRYRGEKHQMMRADGDGPINSVEAVILKAAAVVSKTYYMNSYVDGSVEAPDCFSTDGIVPEATSKRRQSPTCATCPHNAWGSRPPAKPGDPPRKGKACADTKRLAIVLAGQLLDGTAEQIGAMLLRVPPASLQDVAMYGTSMSRYGYPEYSVVTRIAFDPKEVFPKLTFGAVRALNEEEARIVVALRDSEQTDRVLAERDLEAAATIQPETVAQSPFEQPGKSEAWTMAPMGAQGAPPTSVAGSPATQPYPTAQASPAASLSPETPTQPTVAKTPSTTETSMTGGGSAAPAQTAGLNGSQKNGSGSKSDHTSAPSAVPDQPFVNTGGTATFAGTPVSQSGSSQPSSSPEQHAASSPSTEKPSPGNSGDVTTKSFEDDLEDKLSALLP